MRVTKRNGQIVEFDADRIIRAIENAMSETIIGIDSKLSTHIAFEIKNKNFDSISVEEIQDIVENKLMGSDRKDVAKQYILYRNERKTNRNKKQNVSGLLSEDFLAKYKHRISPMNQLGSFVYYRTYSRYLPEEQRREYWWETVKRAVEYNCSLVPSTTKEEAENLFDNIYNLKQFLSGRTFWIGGTKVAKKFPISGFNCAYRTIDGFDAYKDMFYLLMLGAGFGFRVLKEDVEKLPKVRTDIKIIHQDYTSVSKNKRQDNTSLSFFSNNTVEIIVGDSKEGWSQSLDYFLKILYDKDFRDIENIILNYNHVRPKGEKLKTFGGTASGYGSLKAMFKKIGRIIEKAGNRDNSNYINLKPIDCMDIANVIGENVVVGGVRRTSENTLFGEEDIEIAQAKNNLYVQYGEEWVENSEISHRKMSNNSIFYKKKPTREKLHWQIEQMKFSGEPGFINAESASKRRDNFQGVNPCFEILLDSKGLCNLTTVNVMGFVKDGKLNVDGLLDAQFYSARAGYRMATVELELHDWNLINKRDRLVGCSLTGWQDMVDSTGMTKKEETILLKQLRDVAHRAVNEYSKQLGLNKPLLVCTIKPEGTLSLLPGVSSGLHYSHSPYYIRRVRINANDPLVKVCEDLEYNVLSETNQDWETCNTKVIEFPVKSYANKTKYDVTAIEQLENYKMFMQNYVDHNASITVTVKEDEWEDVEEWLWNNWDEVVAVSFLSLSNSFYPLMPYETITEEEYKDLNSSMKPFLPSLISKYEVEETEFDLDESSCENGICPVR